MKPSPGSRHGSLKAILTSATSLLALAQLALAQTTAPTSTTPLPGPDVGDSLLRVTGALVFVMALFFVGVWAVRNGHRLRLRGGKAPRLQVVEARSLGHRQTLFVIAYDERQFLVGTTLTGVSLLTELTSDHPETTATPSTGFANTLRNALERST